MVSSATTLLVSHLTLISIPIGPTDSQASECLLRLLGDPEGGALMPAASLSDIARKMEGQPVTGLAC